LGRFLREVLPVRHRVHFPGTTRDVHADGRAVLADSRPSCHQRSVARIAAVPDAEETVWSRITIPGGWPSSPPISLRAISV